ncbi:MAG: DMT family transporter [Candidatus Rokuibacteriota bacterium]
MAALLALTAALGFALARVIVRRALPHTTPLTAVIVSIICTGAVLWIVALLTAPLSKLATLAVWPFVLAGLLAPGLSRLLVYVGIDRIGAARASAIAPIAPFSAILLAVVFLGERPSASLLAGAICIVVGTILLAQQERGSRAWRRRDLMFPLLGAMGFGFRDVISRWGLQSFPHPTVAAVVATMTSAILIAAFAQRRRGELRADRAGVGLLLLAGTFEALGSVALWAALASGHVSVVTPLAHAQPMFTVVLATLLLRDLEQVTWRVAVATPIMVAGAIAVIYG